MTLSDGLKGGVALSFLLNYGAPVNSFSIFPLRV